MDFDLGQVDGMNGLQRSVQDRRDGCPDFGANEFMQLTKHTDYALRLLIHLARSGDERVAIAEVAKLHGISQAHLLKVANHLAHLGFIETTRGRGGGVRLARKPGEINLAEIVRATEPGTDLVQCGGCGILGMCNLPSIFRDGIDAFHAVLAEYTLADLLRDRAGGALAASPLSSAAKSA